jgi:hypothetical protein
MWREGGQKDSATPGTIGGTGRALQQELCDDYGICGSP